LAGHACTCRYFWHSSKVSVRVRRDFAIDTTSSTGKTKTNTPDMAPTASRFPSGLKATLPAPALSAGMVTRFSPLVASHRLAAPSSPVFPVRAERDRSNSAGFSLQGQQFISCERIPNPDRAESVPKRQALPVRAESGAKDRHTIHG
jgi:hypothetical protein